MIFVVSPFSSDSNTIASILSDLLNEKVYVCENPLPEASDRASRGQTGGVSGEDNRYIVLVYDPIEFCDNIPVVDGLNIVRWARYYLDIVKHISIDFRILTHVDMFKRPTHSAMSSYSELMRIARFINPEFTNSILANSLALELHEYFRANSKYYVCNPLNLNYNIYQLYERLCDETDRQIF